MLAPEFIEYPGGELYHYGVKGMKWGERKTERIRVKADKSEADLRKIASSYKKRYEGMPKADLVKRREKVQNRIDKLDMNVVLGGLGYVGDPKMAKLALATEKRGIKAPLARLKFEERENIAAAGLDKRQAKVMAGLVLSGAAQTAVLVGGATVAAKTLYGLNPKFTTEAQIGTAMLGAAYSANVLRVAGQAFSFERLTLERGEIDRELRKHEK